MTQPDLFLDDRGVIHAARYPEVPGSKGDLDTGKAAAASIDANTLRAACLQTLRTGDYTADEIASRVGSSILAIRPRISELRAKNLIAPTDLRRPNASGRKAAVWKLA